MSFGAISKPAVAALAGSAKLAGIWINTGEGGASDGHLSSGADVVCQIGTTDYGVSDEHRGALVGRQAFLQILADAVDI